MGLYAARQRGKYPVWQSLDHIKFFPSSGIILVTVTVSKSISVIHIALMQFQGDFALYVEQLTLDQLQSEIMEALREMYPNITVPEPIDIHLSTWASHALYRGSYSNWGPSYVPAQSENLKATVDNRLWFAGEATSVQHFGVSCVMSLRSICC